MHKRLLGLLALATMTAPAQAAYVIDTGDPTGGSALTLFSTSTDSQALAGRITLATDTVITSIEGNFHATDTRTITVRIFNDGAVPSGFPFLFDTFVPVVGDGWQGLFNLDQALAAGSYWIAFSASGPNNGFAMRADVPNPLSGYAFKRAVNPFATMDYTLGFRLADNRVTSAVPEPASWALMIAGFGLVGASMRRHASAAARCA